MTVSSSEQLKILALAAALGFLLGALYDVFRVLRLGSRMARRTVFVQDMVYWLVCAVASYVFMFAYNSGQVRWFVLAGELAGAAAYYFTLGAIVYRSARAIIGFAGRAFRTVRKCLALPLVFLYNSLRPYLRIFNKKLKKTEKNIANLFKLRMKQYRIVIAGRAKRKAVQGSRGCSDAKVDEKPFL